MIRRARAAALLLLATIAPAQVPPSRPGEITVVGERDRTRSDWFRGESDNFLVYGRDEGDVRRVATKLERFDQLLRTLTAATRPVRTHPLPVYLLSGELEVRQLRRQYLGRNVSASGYYSAAPTGTLLAADMRWDQGPPGGPSYADVWLFTEYTRHFMQQNAQGAYLPAWYVDGLSLYLATARFGAAEAQYGTGAPDLDRHLAQRKWEPIERIVSGELRQGQLYSAESMLLVHYITADPGRVRAFFVFLSAARRGTPAVAAFEQAFGLRMAALQSTLWAYRYEAKAMRTALPGAADPAITLSRLPRSADGLLLDQAAMRIGIPQADRQQAVLRHARAAMADRGDLFAHRVLAEAEILFGTPAAADASLDLLLGTAPADADLLYLKGLRHLMAARQGGAEAPAALREARRWFARAYRIDPDHAAALYFYAESLSDQPQFVSDNTINILLKAAEAAPQATQLRAKAGERPARAELLQLFRSVANWKDLNCC